MDASFVFKKFKEPNWIMSEEVFFSYDSFFNIGRPVFGIYLNDTKFGEGKIDAVVKFVQAKILGIPVERINNSNCTEEALIALLNIRVPLPLASYGLLPETPSSTHMRIIRSLSESRDMSFGFYGNEPVLASYHFAIGSILMYCSELIRKFLCDKCDVGGQMLAYIYILARDQVFIKSWYCNNTHLFKVRELLEQIDLTCASILETGLEFNATQENIHLSNIAEVIIKRLGSQQSEDDWIEDRAKKSQLACRMLDFTI
jgi:hypothetical protein